ncbi:MAG: sugar ABC transporter permease [Myxococcaceae bacterium]|nr:sugar ABC transporter permease [Myxococcaceae bacterium]
MTAPALQQPSSQQTPPGAEAPRALPPPPPAPPGAPSHRLRFAVGVLVASLVVTGLSWMLLSRARAGAALALEERKATVATLALADLVVRAGGSGDGVRQALAAWQQQAPAGAQAKVIAFDGLSLEAATDAGLGAPRRLQRDEKPLYDQGQRLRAAVETNREESVVRKEEVEIAAQPDGSLLLAAPVELDGQVRGMVEVRTPRVVVAPSPSSGSAGLALLLPLVAFFALALVLGERRVGLALAATFALALGVGFYAWHSVSVVVEDRRAASEEVADSVRTQAETARELISRLGLPADPPVVASSWDADAFRKPRGWLTAAGQVDAGVLAGRLAQASGDVVRALVAVALLALLLLQAIGLGSVGALGRTLVTHRRAYAYVAPALVGMLVLVFFPFFYGITLSFTDSNLLNTSRPLTELWVGLKNYVDILSDFDLSRTSADGARVANYTNFYWTLGVTVVWTVTNVVIGVSVGLLLALVLNTRGLALRPVYRVLLILPWAMPNYITSLIWRGMFHQQFGVVNHVLALFGGEPVSWFETPFTSFLTALTTNGWLSFPFMMVVSLGALQSIPVELYEAARVDGASRWQQFRAITLPSLKPALVPAVILSVVWTFNQFNVIYLVTAGEPGGSTEILITQSYKFAFEKYRYGYAAAYSTVIFGILLVYGVFQNRVTKATEAV